MVSWSGLNKPAERSPKGKLREFSALTIEVGINAKRLLCIFDSYLNFIFLRRTTYRSLEKFGALKLDHGPKPELGGETVSVGGTCKNSTCKEVRLIITITIGERIILHLLDLHWIRLYSEGR